MMIAMPVLTLEKLHQREPSHVAAGILPVARAWLGMADAVDEALRMQREDQAYRAEPEKRGEPKYNPPKNDNARIGTCKNGPDIVREVIEVGTEALDRRLLAPATASADAPTRIPGADSRCRLRYPPRRDGADDWRPN